MTLFRPVGLNELKLMFESGMRSFPPRLPEQPLFYPVVTLEYAVEIARNWNTNVDPFAGYVTEFALDDEFLSKYPEHFVGALEHRELWVPAEDLEVFNSHLLGPIKVRRAFFGSHFKGLVPANFNFKGRDALAQLIMLSTLLEYNGMDFIGEVNANSLAVYLHISYWRTCSLDKTVISDERRVEVIHSIEKVWSKALPGLPQQEIGAP